MISDDIGPYRILDKLGEGGMGEVYRARDTRLGRDVAIKVLPAAFTSDPDRLARFEREARTLAALNHPHIAAIYGIEEAKGARALVLELVEGETLADRVARGLKVGDALAIARQIVSALDAAHEKGVVHRDLKPRNIMLTKSGAVKVLDFGLAKFDEHTPSGDLTQSPTMALSATREGVIFGTAAYMSPEQTRGQAIDKRTDIWAFGCVLYEMLTGRAPFARETLSDTIAAILEHAPDWSLLPRETPGSVRRLLQRCLEKNPSRRTRDIGDVQLELDEIEKEPATAATSATPVPSNRFTVPFAVVAIVALGRSRRYPPDVDGRRPRADVLARHTTRSRPGRRTGPAISPDGKWIAYLSNARGPTDVWVRFLSGGDPSTSRHQRTLDIQSRADLGGLAISPDGSTIAFDAGATRDAGPHATTRGRSQRRSAAHRARRWSSVARCAGHRTARRSRSCGPDRRPETRCGSPDPTAAARAKWPRYAARCTFTGRCGRTTDTTSTSTTPARRRTESRRRSTVSPPRVDRWSRWCRPRGARSLPSRRPTARV